MPAKNSVKLYTENGYYHIYNRGVEKRTVFLDHRDYITFLHLLKHYLDPDEITDSETGLPNRMNLSKEITLLAYCLMPNHFHLLIKQITKDGMTKLMKRLTANYSMHFNWRYNRVGPLFQGIYKAVNVDTDGQLLHLSRYIHRNPVDLKFHRTNPSREISPLASYPYSSYRDYMRRQGTKWISTEVILNYFGTSSLIKNIPTRSYAEFVEQIEYDEDLASLENLLVDSDDPQ